jgi:transcriptional regulator with XRE-family HTH domain
MAWKEVTTEELAKSLGVNASEVREKQKLIQMIVRIRKEQKMSQTVLAKKASVTQGRIAQIESGVGSNRVSFDVLLNILTLLGYDFKITSKKAA